MFDNLFSHWVFWLVVTLLVLVAMTVIRFRGYKDKIEYSIEGKKGWLGFDAVWWGKNYKRFNIGVLVLGLLLMVVGCSGGSVETAPPVTAINCQGSYVGNYGPPDHEERIRLRNLSLSNRGIAVVADEAENNRNAGGGDPDGGIWMGGSHAFETDANCNVIKGKTLIFYAYEYDVSGTVQKDGTFKLTWSGQGSAGDMVGKVDSTGNISGQFFHPAPDNFVYGVISGAFVSGGKI